MSSRRLDTVLRIRELRERLARAEVGRQTAALAARRDAEREAHEILDRATVVDHRLPGALLRGHHAMLSAGLGDIHHAHDQVIAASGAVAAAMNEWTLESRRLEGVERLAERAAEEERVEEERRTAVEMDDLVIAGWASDERADDGIGPR